MDLSFVTSVEFQLVKEVGAILGVTWLKPLVSPQH